MTQDRFLLAILIAIGVLVAVAVGLFFIREDKQDYGLEDTPQGVLRNYIIALEKDDYQRAYGYLQDADGKPDFDHFRQAFLTRQLDLSSTALQIGESRRSGEVVFVPVVVIHGSNEPFENPYRESTNAVLVKEDNGNWKIANLPYPYWRWNWFNSGENVPVRPSP